ncbi:hypothetical protein TKK_0000134 [Trichogramma kaykai]
MKHKFTPQICPVASPNSEVVQLKDEDKSQFPRSSSKPRFGKTKDMCWYHHSAGTAIRSGLAAARFFFSKKFSSSERKYAPYDLEFTAIYMAIKYFHNELEARDFDVWCDHNPLQYAFSQAPEYELIVRQRQLAYISQYTTSIKYLPGAENSVADALSLLDASEVPIHSPVDVNVDVLALPLAQSLKQLSKEQAKDEQLQAILSDPDFPRSLQKGIYPIENQLLSIYSNVSDDAIRPYITLSLRRAVFNLFHRFTHPGLLATDKFIRRKYVWPCG